MAKILEEVGFDFLQGACQDLYRELQGDIRNIYLIGGSRQGKNFINAIWDAYKVACTI